MTRPNSNRTTLLAALASLLIAASGSEVRAAEDHGKMDHGKMDHGKMDHGKADPKPKKESARDAAKSGQVVEMRVTEQGFEPAALTVTKGKAVTLLITRTTDKTCATDIVIDEHAIKTALPLNKPVKVSFTPRKTGELKYGCAMNKMIGGVLTVQ